MAGLDWSKAGRGRVERRAFVAEPFRWTYLSIPHARQKEAWKLGARYDRLSRMWRCIGEPSPELLALQDRVAEPARQGPAIIARSYEGQIAARERQRARLAAESGRNTPT